MKNSKGRKRKKKANKEPAAPSGDIVDALRKALSRRNQSIMGGMDAHVNKNEEVLEDEEEGEEDSFALPDIS